MHCQRLYCFSTPNTKHEISPLIHTDFPVVFAHIAGSPAMHAEVLQTQNNRGVKLVPSPVRDPARVQDYNPAF